MMEQPIPKGHKGYKAWLRTDDFVFITIVSMLIPLMVHTANLLLQISIVQNVYYAYFFAFAFDLGIFVHAIHGNDRVSTGLAFIVFLLNIAFFNLTTFNEYFSPQGVKLIISTLISGTAAYLIHSYVEMYFHKQRQEKDDMRIWEQLKHQKEVIESQGQQLEKYKGIENELAVLKAETKAKERGLSILENITTKPTVLPMPKTTGTGPPMKLYSCGTCAKRVAGAEAYEIMANSCYRKDCTEKAKLKNLNKVNAPREELIDVNE
jgi:hypothetical protein